MNSSQPVAFSRFGAFALIAVGCAGGLFVTPPDYLQGDSARILYIHVPSAWLGMGGWTGSDDGDVDVHDEYDDYDDEAVVTDEELTEDGDVSEGVRVFVEAEEIEP